MVFYTDGLVERPRVGLTQSIEKFIAAVRGAASPDEICDLAVEALVPLEGGLRDDVAIVAVQHDELPAALRLRLPADPGTLAQLRRTLRRWLHKLGVDRRTASEITLAVNEACANAIQHAYSPAPAEFDVHASASDDEVMIEVSDTGRWRSPRGQNRGRGLTIIDATMDTVSIESAETGTRVVLRRGIRR